VIYVGIDDTDIIGSPGTNRLARKIVWRLGPVARGTVVCRHQLFFDPRVPFTSGNGSASIQLPHGDDIPRDELLAAIRDEMRAFFVEGSDPGLAVATSVSDDMRAFASRAKREVVTQAEARAVAAQAACHL
jgi:tRNA(Ile2) C34 agmatinyltransferase TiaS